MDLNNLNLDHDLHCCGEHDHTEGHHCCGHHDSAVGHHCCGHHDSADGHHCCGHHNPVSPITLTQNQAGFLRLFALYPFLPLVRFLYHASQEDDLESIGLSAVYLERGDETLEQVKATAALLESLEEKNLITLDYDIPLNNYEYTLYEDSVVFSLFKEAVAEGAKRPCFLFDTADLETGSMALTELGQQVLEKLAEM